MEAAPIFENPVPPPVGQVWGGDRQFESDAVQFDNKKARTLRSAWQVAQGRRVTDDVELLVTPSHHRVGIDPVMGTDRSTRAPIEVIQERIRRVQTRGHPLTPSQVTVGVPQGASMTEDEYYGRPSMFSIRTLPHAYVYGNQAVYETTTEPQSDTYCVLQ